MFCTIFNFQTRSRKEFSEIASTLFYIFGYAKVFYSELDFIKFVMDEHPSATECYIYNFSRDGIAEGIMVS